MWVLFPDVIVFVHLSRRQKFTKICDLRTLETNRTLNGHATFSKKKEKSVYLWFNSASLYLSFLFFSIHRKLLIHLCSASTLPLSTSLCCFYFRFPVFVTGLMALGKSETGWRPRVAATQRQR